MSEEIQISDYSKMLRVQKWVLKGLREKHEQLKEDKKVLLELIKEMTSEYDGFSSELFSQIEMILEQDND